jgi:hypothetical protein
MNVAKPTVAHRPSRVIYASWASADFAILFGIIIGLRLGYLYCIPYTNELGVVFENAIIPSQIPSPWNVMKETCAAYNATSRELVQQLGNLVAAISVIHAIFRNGYYANVLPGVLALGLATILGWTRAQKIRILDRMPSSAQPEPSPAATASAESLKQQGME